MQKPLSDIKIVWDIFILSFFVSRYLRVHFIQLLHFCSKMVVNNKKKLCLVKHPSSWDKENSQPKYIRRLELSAICLVRSIF